MGKNFKTFLKKNTANMCQWAHQKMLSMTSHQWNENQNKSVYCFTPTGMHIIKDRQITNVGKDMEEIGTLIHQLVEDKMDAAALENNLAVPQKLSKEVSYNPAIPLLGYIPGRWKNMFTIKTCTQFQTSIIYDSQKMEKKKQLMNG